MRKNGAHELICADGSGQMW